MQKTSPELTSNQEINVGGKILRVSTRRSGQRVGAVGVGVYYEGNNRGGRNELVGLETTHPETFQALINLAEAMERDNAKGGGSQTA